MMPRNGVAGVVEAAKAKHAEQSVQTERVTMKVGRKSGQGKDGRVGALS